MPTKPVIPDEYPRPRAGSWLDKKSRRMMELLDERHGLKGFEEDSTRRALAAGLKFRLDALSQQMGIGTSEAQRYFDDETLISIVDATASPLSGEITGGDPFADPDQVLIIGDSWTHSIWSLQLAGQAAEKLNSEWAWSMIAISTSMTVAAFEAKKKLIDLDGDKPIVMLAPRAGALYAARTLSAASEMIESWNAGYRDLSATDLAGGLRRDSDELTTQINR